MPLAARQITPQDIMPDAEFVEIRTDRRKTLLPSKKLRRIAVGPDCTFYFESYETMLFQIQEMLHIEQGGEEQLADELEAYNPLIPNGGDLVATVMFEIDDAERRLAVLLTLGGIENQVFIRLGDEKVRGVAEEDVERTTEDGKTSSVHFFHFPFTAAQIERFKDPATEVMVGTDHANYAHLAILSPGSRAELATDFA